MRIAILHPSLVTRGGAENAVVWLATELGRRGHEVTVFTYDFDSSYFGDPGHLPFRLRLLPEAGPYGLRRQSRSRWEATARALARELAGFQVVNPHNFPAYLWAWRAKQLNPSLGPLLWYAEDFGFHSHVIDVQHPTEETRLLRTENLLREAWLFFWRRPGLPRLQTLYRLMRLRGMARWLEPMDREAVLGMDRVLPNSHFASGWIQRLYGCRPVTCHLGMPMDRFAAAEPRPAAERPLASCSITRLFPAKNVATTLRALALLRDDPDLAGHVHHVIGEGPQLPELRHLADRLGLGTRVEFTGFPVPSLKDYLERSRAFVHIPLEEPFGLVYLEAALLEVPAVASDRGGPAEIVLPMQTGLTVDPTSPEETAAALRTLLLDPELSGTLGRAARKRARSEFSIEAMADRFLAAVDEVLAGKE